MRKLLCLALLFGIACAGKAQSGRIQFFKEDWEQTTNGGYIYAYVVDYATGYYTSTYRSGYNYTLYVRESTQDYYHTKWYLNNTRVGHSGYYLGIRCYDAYSDYEYNPETYFGQSIGSDNIIYWSAGTAGLRDITIDFDWMCSGNAGYDFGGFAVCNGQGSNLHSYDNWELIPRDGDDPNTAMLCDQWTSWAHFHVTYNNVGSVRLRDNPNLSWAVLWTDDYVTGYAPAILIDNITISGCPCEGLFSSTKLTGGSDWTKVGNETATFTITGTHPQAKFQWEASTTSPNSGFSDIAGATTANYTTPPDLSQTTWYRCKVWYSRDSCPGVYCATSFKVHVPEDLPVTLLDFAADCDDEAVRISWSTATETNNDYFVVERSTDGRNFEEINRQKGAGTCNEQRFYDFVDNVRLRNAAYYRLMQVDYDGHKSYSDIVFANCTGLADKPTVDIFPNPTNDSFKVTVDIPAGNTTANLSLLLLDDLGKQVLSKQFTPQSTTFETVVDITKLPPAVYNLHVNYDNFIITKKIVKL